MRGADLLIQQTYSQDEIQFGDLRLTPEQVTVWGENKIDTWIESPAALRVRIREKPFRSLTTRKGLPGGWAIRVKYPQMLHAIVETIYPGAVADWAAQQAGTFRANSFEATIKRQQGNFRQLAEMNPHKSDAVTGKLCTQCARHPSWCSESIPRNSIPCVEPCNHWLSSALESCS